MPWVLVAGLLVFLSTPIAAIAAEANFGSFSISMWRDTYNGPPVEGPLRNGDIVAFTAEVPHAGSQDKLVDANLYWQLYDPKGAPIEGVAKSRRVTETGGHKTSRFRIRLDDLDDGTYTVALTHRHVTDSARRRQAQIRFEVLQRSVTKTVKVVKPPIKRPVAKDAIKSKVAVKPKSSAASGAGEPLSDKMVRLPKFTKSKRTLYLKDIWVSSDGKRVVGYHKGSKSAFILSWDTQTMKRVGKTGKIKDWGFRDNPVLSPNGRVIATFEAIHKPHSNAKRRIHFYDIQSNKTLSSVTDDQSLSPRRSYDSPKCNTFSPDGKFFLAMARDGLKESNTFDKEVYRVDVIDTSSGKIVKTIKDPRIAGPNSQLNLTPDGSKLLVSRGEVGGSYLMTASGLKTTAGTNLGFRTFVLTYPDLALVAEHRIKPALSQAILSDTGGAKPHLGRIFYRGGCPRAVGRDGDILRSDGRGMTLRLSNKTGKWIAVKTKGKALGHPAFSADNSRQVSREGQGRIVVIDTDTLSPIKSIELDTEKREYIATITPNGKYLFYALGTGWSGSKKKFPFVYRVRLPD